MAADPPSHDETCFLVAPIGSEGSEVRKRSDGVRDFIVRPAAEEVGLKTLRADDLNKPGQITLQVIEHVLRARAVVADLTGANANVYYELAVRHTAKLPVVLIAEADEIDRLPFDISQMRVIGFTHTDLASAAAARESIAAYLREALQGAVDSPVATVLNLEALEQGTSVERVLADLVTRVDDLSRSFADFARRSSGIYSEPIGDAGRDAVSAINYHDLARAVQSRLAEARIRARVTAGSAGLTVLVGPRSYNYVLPVNPGQVVEDVRKSESDHGGLPLGPDGDD